MTRPDDAAAEMDATDLYYLTRRLRALLEPQIEAVGTPSMSIPQQIVFRDVIEFAGSTVKAISERRHIAQSVVSKAIADGREMGLLSTKTDPTDRRRALTYPTPLLTDTVYARLGTDVREILEPALAGMSSAQKESIVRSLAALLEGVKRNELPPLDAP